MYSQNNYIYVFSVNNRIEFRSSQGLQSEPHQNRPTTLYPLKLNDGITPSAPDALLPEREPLRFDVALAGAPPEVEQLVSNIKQVAEQFLYHWKTFPISKFIDVFKIPVCVYYE